MSWWRRTGLKSDIGYDVAGIRWTVSDKSAHAVVTVEATAAKPGFSYTNFSAVVLSAPVAGTDQWIASNFTTATLENNDELRIYAPLLFPATGDQRVRETRSYTLPVSVEQVVGLVFTSQPNRMWVETGHCQLWLVNDELRPGLHDWVSQIGTNPLVHRRKLVVSDKRADLLQLDTLRLSDVEDIDGT